MEFLSPREKAQASEALQTLARVNDIQVESSSSFKIKPGRRVLVLVLTEMDCRSALTAAVTYFKEVHLILSYSVTSTKEQGHISQFVQGYELRGGFGGTKVMYC